MKKLMKANKKQRQNFENIFWRKQHYEWK
jgi:hypothetical protein